MTGDEADDMERLRCPHCTADLTGEWVNVSVSWSGPGHRSDTEVRCPECGRDMTETPATEVTQ